MSNVLDAMRMRDMETLRASLAESASMVCKSLAEISTTNDATVAQRQWAITTWLKLLDKYAAMVKSHAARQEQLSRLNAAQTRDRLEKERVRTEGDRAKALLIKEARKQERELAQIDKEDNEPRKNST